MTALTTHRTLVLASVMAANFMIAIEATIVSTAMPQIAAQLGGLELYSWVFAAFLLTQTATTVVFGKLSDLRGRKVVMLSGIAIFLVGSILCGFAWSMPALIAFRLLQGVGAGAVQPTAMTIVGDLYSVHERGKIQGWLASVWAISAVLGPLVGVAHHPVLVVGLDLLDEPADRRSPPRPDSGSTCTRRRRRSAGRSTTSAPACSPSPSPR